MNKHSIPTAASGFPCLTSGSTAGQTEATSGKRYRYRTTRDVEVSIGRVSGEGFDADLIETAGEPYDASCADCLETRPLDDDGFCEKCVDASELSLSEFAIKYHPRIYLGKAV